jgi:hypothetical protein
LPTTTAESFSTRISYVLLAVGYTLCTMALLWPRERSASTQVCPGWRPANVSNGATAGAKACLGIGSSAP